jgi:thiosulfate/3-mercaptopyruvate sulfurtransferase
MSGFAHPNALVSTQWLADHLHDSHIKLLEVGWDSSEYEAGHIPGTVAGWGLVDVQGTDGRDIPDEAEIGDKLSQAGIAEDDTVVIYGGLGNLIAAMAFWVLTVYGHGDVRLLDGGLQKWLSEKRAITTERPSVVPTRYVAQGANSSLRADSDFISGIIGNGHYTLVDARSAAMYAGEDGSGMKHAGHIPTAVNVPAERVLDADGNFQGWQTPTTNSDGTFKSREQLQALFSDKGVSADKHIITYCVLGGLSSHMWFTLTQLLGYPNAREYYRSWAEWGNLADVPIAT